jgi:hypothetical protein
MNDHRASKTLGVVTLGEDSGSGIPLFRVNAAVPLEQALEQVSNLLYCAKHLALEAAIDPDAKRLGISLPLRDEQGSY